MWKPSLNIVEDGGTGPIKMRWLKLYYTYLNFLKCRTIRYESAVFKNKLVSARVDSRKPGIIRPKYVEDRTCGDGHAPQ